MAASPLRLLRVEADLSQKELAELADVDPSYLSILETDPDANPGVRLAWRLATALSEKLGRPVTISDLFPMERYSSSRATKSA